MDSSTHPNRCSLEAARDARKKGEYSEALRHYAYFFEHALDGDPASLYGVRLSYCLDEWARLGKVYPPALEALNERRKEALRRFEATQEPEDFHDFEVISKYLDVHDEAIDSFMAYHATDRRLAALAVRFVWSKLVARGAWDICGCYIGDPNERYRGALLKFDQAMKVSRENPDFGGADLEKQTKGWYVRDVSELLLVLINTGQAHAGAKFRTQAESDMLRRGYAEVVSEIASQVAL
jgi:hypothetical protein